jgi:hypothetical protein
MTALDFPDSIDLRVAPELGALALLDAALVVADHALHVEHAELDAALRRLDPDRPPEFFIAALLAGRLRELRTLVAAYIVAVRRAGCCDDLPF